jgi:hypothetical protein
MGGAALVPVADLAKLEDPHEPTPVAFQTENPEQSNSLTGEKPGPVPEDKINGDSGRPTRDQAKSKESNLNLSVNRNKSQKEQMKSLEKTVESLKNNGIDATLHIGFNEEKE